jgi:broad specificity phosphatase PhoE
MLRRLLLQLLLGLPLAAPAFAQQAPIVVYLVRHAERAEDGTNDPPISGAGERRARLLADMLRDAALTSIHTTDFLRTRATAAPVASDTGIQPAVYDDEELEAFAVRLRASPGRHLVVGHSNTTPELVLALGGEPHGEIAQDEYDRLYVLTLAADGVTTVLLRF